jgi:small nuclear ribonucleoprotein (snRNP)-like protein
VVSGSDKITVVLKDGRSFTGTIYGIDTLTDLAIVKVDATGLPAAAMGDSSALQVGQLAIAIEGTTSIHHPRNRIDDGNAGTGVEREHAAILQAISQRLKRSATHT